MCQERKDKKFSSLVSWEGILSFSQTRGWAVDDESQLDDLI